MRQRQNEQARNSLTTTAHRAPPAPKVLTEFDHERIERARQKRARKASRLVPTKIGATP